MKDLINTMKNRNILLLWSGTQISQLGDSINYIAIITLVYKITKSGLSVASVTVFELIPVLIIGLFAGVLLDKLKIKSILIVSDLARGVIILFLIYTQNSVIILLITAFLSFGDSFSFPGRNSLLPRIVSKDKLIIANSLFFFSFNISMIVGPILGGILVGFYHINMAFIINSLSFFISALLLFFMKTPEQIKSEKHNDSMIKEVKNGFNFIRNDKGTSYVFFILFLIMIGRGAINSLIIVFLEEGLGKGVFDYGLFCSITCIGLVLGSFLSGIMAKKLNDYTLFSIFILLSGITYILYSITQILQQCCFL